MTDDELRALALAALADDACGVCHGEFLAACDPQTILSLLDRLQAAERDAARLDWLESAYKSESLILDIFYDGDFGFIDTRMDDDDPKRVFALAPTLRAAIDAAQGAQDTPGDA